MNQMVLGGICTEIIVNKEKKIVELGIDVKRNYKEKDGTIGTDFFKVRVEGRKANFIEKYYEEGRLVSVIGKLENRKIINNKEIYYTSEVVAEEINYTDWKTKKKTTKKSKDTIHEVTT